MFLCLISLLCHSISISALRLVVGYVGLFDSFFSLLISNVNNTFFFNGLIIAKEEEY